MVGDRASTDGAFAERLGVTFALVRTGVTAEGDYADLADAVARLLT
jgi:ribonucleotide monophosphatase NagD (HAD superfamily)